MKENSFCLICALGGALVGAAIAMLTAPQSGRELRGRIRNAVNETMEDICHCHGEGCHHHPEDEVATQK